MRDPDSSADRPRPGRPLRPRAVANAEAGTPPSHAQTNLAVRTRREVGRIMGLSAQRVQQIEAVALAKLRVRLRGLAEEMGVVT